MVLDLNRVDDTSGGIVQPIGSMLREKVNCACVSSRYDFQHCFVSRTNQSKQSADCAQTALVLCA